MCQHFASTSHFDFKGVGWAYPKKVHGGSITIVSFLVLKDFSTRIFWALFDATIHQVSSSSVAVCTDFIKGWTYFQRHTYVVFKIIFFYILWKKSRLKLNFLPYHVKKNRSTLEVDTFKVMLLLSYLASHDNKPRT